MVQWKMGIGATLVRHIIHRRRQEEMELEEAPLIAGLCADGGISALDSSPVSDPPTRLLLGRWCLRHPPPADPAVIITLRKKKEGK